MGKEEEQTTIKRVVKLLFFKPVKKMYKFWLIKVDFKKLM
jgi:hypothetical protein